ncbi:MAG: DUF4363 family protein [Oscillospiraceae bacterium]|nr:DUF4363 family protein [Oscillospiraceae bacterium]
MRSVIISAALMILIIAAISVNSYYINSVSTEMLNLTFALPSEYNYIDNLDEKNIEKYKTEINKLEVKWEKNASRISYVSKYSDFERVNTALYNLKEYFFAGEYAEYAAARKRLIAALEKQKQNELPLLENIF